MITPRHYTGTVMRIIQRMAAFMQKGCSILESSVKTDKNGKFQVYLTSVSNI